MRIPVGKHSLYISEGNSKMGNVYSISTLPVLTCNPNVPCSSEGCYAIKLYKRFKVVSNTWEENTNTILEENVDTIVSAIVSAINLYNIKLFRWNVGGDFHLKNYFEIAIKVAEQCPSCKFLAFTKCYNLIDTIRPSNFNLIVSVWKDYGSNINSPNVGYAYYNDGTCSIPLDAVECSGMCDKCMKCFDLRPNQKVYFNKH